MEEKEKQESVEQEQQAGVETKQEESAKIPTSAEGTTDQVKGKKHQTFFLVLLFVVFLAFVYFLPEITSLIKKQQQEQELKASERDGTMRCTFTREGENVDYDIEQVFTYEDNSLKKSTITTTNRVKGNSAESNIVNAEQSCENLKQSLALINGITIDCQGSEMNQVTTETIDYTILDLNDLTSNVAELGGFAPEYELNQNMNTIERGLEQNGYTCSRTEY